MEQGQKWPFSGLRSRFETAARTSGTGRHLSSADASKDTKGAIGLTTLHEPRLPVKTTVDMVFVHGLGGGSRKTWSFSPATHHFWPQAWLPADLEFSGVRIHSFGYNADWGERVQSIMNIHGFAQSLLGELRNHPSIRREATHIIFVGHSMGGCVVKKAYILARQDPTCAGLAKRVHSMFFLGTPHRGSNMAALLENILLVASRKKPFVADLTPNSATVSQINDAFRHVAPDLRLWSFYETLPVKSGPMSGIVVERHSATLGYYNEETTAMNADHRHVCKFDTPDDPNYKVLRNALLTAVDSIKASRSDNEHLLSTLDPQSNTPDSKLIARLGAFLAVEGVPEDDLASCHASKEPGTCAWLTEKQFFTSWKTGDSSQILWLAGRPATGKSILSSHVIDQLKQPQAYCSYFFYKSSMPGKSTLGDCFRSLALQMAIQDISAREKILQLEEEGLAINKSDDSSVWRKIFVNAVFKLSSAVEHFWVIDGIDECINYNALFTKGLLTAIPLGLRVFVTSRRLEPIERGLTSLGNRASLQIISDTDTLPDIRTFISSKLKELDRLESDQKYTSMCENILARSSGSFLWARLVIDELDSAWTEEDMWAVLQEIPDGLYDMYSRMLRSIEVQSRTAVLAKCILTWIALVPRPLALEELCSAVKLDLNQNLQKADMAVPALCGQLVFVDSAGKVHMIHETAREFVLMENLHSELAVKKGRGNFRIARTLLKYLASGVLKQKQAKRQTLRTSRGFARHTIPETFDDALLDYAAKSFSNHLRGAYSKETDLLGEIHAFLNGEHALFWIEYLASINCLSDIILSAMNILSYLADIAHKGPSTESSKETVDNWASDLIRVTANFQNQLLTSPSSIHTLIPALCPSASTISRHVAHTIKSQRLLVKGLAFVWDDCVIRLGFSEGLATTVRYGDRYIAVGFSTGQISLYNPNTGQRVLNMAHAERVKLLDFSPDGQGLASCGANRIILWNTKTGSQVHAISIQSTPLALTFLDSTSLLGAFQTGELTKWNPKSGAGLTVSWRSRDEEFSSYDLPVQPPSTMAFMMGTEDILLAVGYRGQPIAVWNVTDLQCLGHCGPDDGNGINSMVFNPNSDVVALVVSYHEGGLCIFDYHTMSMTFRAPNMFKQCIACSADGRTLVTGSNRGIIEVFGFEHDECGAVLFSVYRIVASEDMIRDISFSPDGSRFVDVQRRQGRVWAPAALIRRNNDLDRACKAVPTIPAVAADMLSEQEAPEISSNLVATADGRCIIVGKRGGDIVLFSTSDASEVDTLYRHAYGVSVTVVAIAESRNLIISADDSGRVLGAELAMPLASSAAAPQTPDQKSPAARTVLDRRFGGAVTEILVNSAADRILICGRNAHELWEIPSGNVLKTTSPLPGIDGPVAPWPASYAVFQHPTEPAWFVRVDGCIARVYSWRDSVELTSAGGIKLERGSPTTDAPRQQPTPQQGSVQPDNSMISFHVGPASVIELIRAPYSPTRLYHWPAACFEPQASAASALPVSEPNLALIGPAVSSILGFLGTSMLLFLDINLWVCSTELQSTASARNGTGIGSIRPGQPDFHARRHFFALSEWCGIEEKLRCVLAAVPTAPPRSRSRDVVFANGHRVVVVKGGLEYSENVAINNGHSHRVSTETVGGELAGQQVWRPVSGSMHRSNW